jgi:hypothetical protein
MKKLLLLPVLSSIFLGACGANPARELTPTVTTQVPSPLPINTPIPLPSNTPAPTDTPLPPTPTETVSPYLFYDEFDGALAEGWRWIGEDSAKWSLTQAPGSVRIILSPAKIFEGEPRNFLLRVASEGNFELGTLVRFTPTSNFQFAGLLIYLSQGNAMQFGRAFANCANPSVCLGMQFTLTLSKTAREASLISSLLCKILLRLIYVCVEKAHLAPDITATTAPIGSLLGNTRVTLPPYSSA